MDQSIGATKYKLQRENNPSNREEEKKTTTTTTTSTTRNVGFGDKGLLVLGKEFCEPSQFPFLKGITYSYPQNMGKAIDPITRQMNSML